MDASAVLTLVQTFLQVLDSPISREIQSSLGYASQLHKLRNTISTIEAVLVNFEKQQRLQLPTSISGFTLDRLKEAVYEADDLFDEIATIAQRKKLSGHKKLSQEVRLSFSRFNHFYYAFTKSREIKKIREGLDAIAKDHRDFGLMQGQVPTFEETHFMMISLKEIVPAASNNIDTRFILLDKGKVTAEGGNKTCLALVADETAAVHFQFWGWECDFFQRGDIINLSHGIFSFQRSNLVLRAGKRGKIEKAGEFTLPYVETPNMSEICWAPDPKNPKKLGVSAVIITEEQDRTVFAAAFESIN